MTRTLYLTGCLCLATGSTLGVTAATLNVRVVTVGVEEGTAPCTLVVDPRFKERPRRMDLRTCDEASLDDLAPGLWEVRLVAADRWAAPAVVHLSDDVAEAAGAILRAFPAAEVTGRLVSNRMDAGAFKRLRLLFSSARTPEAEEPSGVRAAQCAISEDRFKCKLPAGLWDLRVRVPGYVSRFLWDVPLPAKRVTDLGTQELRPGSSLFGFVPACEGESPDPTCRVELAPLRSPAPTADDARRQAGLGTASPVDEHGFFLLEGIAPGVYELTAVKKGFAPAHVFPLQVHSGKESELALPIELERPVELMVRVQPPADPWTRNWNLQLLKSGLGPRMVRPFADGRLENGSWKRDNTPPGRYQLRIEDASGSVWHVEEFEVSAENPVIDVSMPIVTVEGTVTLGESPLAAEIWFGGKYGERRIHTTSQADGYYSVYLPAADSWRIALVSDDPRVSRTLREVVLPEADDSEAVHLDLHLPDTLIFGKAIDPESRPVQGAVVSVLDYTRMEHPVQVRTDETGSFEIRGLGPGTLQISANRGDLHSDEQILFLEDEDSRKRVFLTLRRGSEVTGMVQSSLGPVVGVMLFATPVGSSTGDQRITDVQGRFTTRVPPQTGLLDVVVLAPGLNFTARREPISNDRVNVEVAADGGTLVIPGGLSALRAAAGPDELLILFHESVPIAPGLLAEWKMLQESLGQQTGDEDVAVLPHMAVGEYRACLLRSSEAIELAHGSKDPSRCTSAFVAPASSALLDPEALTTRD